MTDISREEMGLIIGLVLGTLFLALVAVFAYIMYDKQKRKLQGLFRTTVADVDNARPGPTGAGHTWTTINNSMVGLEMDDAACGSVGHDADPVHPQSTSNPGITPDNHKKSCLTVLFDWDWRHPLPAPFRNWACGGVERQESGSFDLIHNVAAPPSVLVLAVPPVGEPGACEVTLQLASAVPSPKPAQDGDKDAMGDGVATNEPLVSLALGPLGSNPGVIHQATASSTSGGAEASEREQQDGAFGDEAAHHRHSDSSGKCGGNGSSGSSLTSGNSVSSGSISNPAKRRCESSGAVGLGLVVEEVCKAVGIAAVAASAVHVQSRGANVPTAMVARGEAMA